MIWFAYFGSAVALSYYLGRNSAGVGIAVFLASVAIWQLFSDGPGSFLENEGCVRYSSTANEC